MNKGRVFIISGPSGSGKDTVLKCIFDRIFVIHGDEAACHFIYITCSQPFLARTPTASDTKAVGADQNVKGE